MSRCRPAVTAVTPPAYRAAALRVVATLFFIAAALVVVGPRATAEPLLDPPVGWYSGDLHTHWPDDCYGVAPPELILGAMPDDLNLASVLLWNGGDLFQANAAAYFTGDDDPVSRPGKIVHYDLEVSGFNIADRLGHIACLNLQDINFPQSTRQGPIQEWAHAQGAIVGSLHSQAWPASYEQFPELLFCCAPFELPVAVVFDRVDYLDYQGPLRARWRFLWYRLLDCGFRLGLAATSDSWCLYNIGQYRTYARIDGGELTYANFLDAVAAGRTVAVENNDNFIHFKVNGLEVGEQIDITEGEQITLEARVILPPGVGRWGTLEIIRNGQAIAQQPYNQTGGVVVLNITDTPLRSSWYSARTQKSHAGAVYVEVDGAPIRASTISATYFIEYLDFLRDVILEGTFFYQLTPEDEAALLAEIDVAQGVYETIRSEGASETGIADQSSASAPLKLLTAWPNPFSNALQVGFQSGDGGPVELRIFGANGRLVRNLISDSGARGRRAIVWDGRDHRGQPVSSGIYYYRLETREGAVGSGTIVRVR